MITQEQLKCSFHYDEDTGLFTRTRGGIMGHSSDAPVGWTERTGYKRMVINGKRYYQHHLAWLYVYGVKPDLIDHIDGNPSNNAINNLRPASHAENMQNISRVNKASPLRGATFDKRRGVWRAQIGINGRNVFIGDFKTATEAHLAYKEAKSKLHTFHSTIERISK